MTDRDLDIAFADYDRTSAVTIDGVEATFHTARIVTEIFDGMIRRRTYGVAELGWTYYLRILANGPSPFVAIPVFPNRAFRHGAIYVNKASGIERPRTSSASVSASLRFMATMLGSCPRAFFRTSSGSGPSATAGSSAALTS